MQLSQSFFTYAHADRHPPCHAGSCMMCSPQFLSCCSVLCCAVLHVLQSHAKLCSAVSALASEVQADEALSKRIKHKFKIKNTVRRSSNSILGAGGIVAQLESGDAAQHGRRQCTTTPAQDRAGAVVHCGTLLIC